MIPIEEPVADLRISPKVRRAVDKWGASREVPADTREGFSDYRRYIARKWIFMAACVAIVFLVMGVAVTVGSYDISFLDSYGIIWGGLERWWDQLLGHEVADLTTPEYVVLDLRLPRIVVGIVAGAGLAVAGAVMQSTLMNPLADPYTTGVSSGASFGATVAMTMGISLASGTYSIIVNAFVFSLIPTVMILFVSRVKKASPTTMIMAGIAIMYIFNAMTTVLMLWADPNQLEEVYNWQVGSLSRVTWDGIPVMIAVTLIGIVIVQFLSRKLNVLATGDDSANALGVDANRMRMILLATVSLISAAIVSFTGLIGFVGLVTPHVVRIFIGADNRYLIPASAVAGAALLVCADLVGRVALAPVVLQVGVVMAFLGGPMFLWLMMRRNSNVWG